ncbi:MAG: NRDE family protein [Bacteroidota bacterium]
MCTVTYIPTKHACFITSSRDENVLRPRAIMPAVYKHNDVNLVYPKDAKANGSWIAFTQNGNAAVLLNGGFIKHLPQPRYRKSRGLVFLDIISHNQPEFCFLGMKLDNIEPFTLVLFIGGYLFEARWDGEQKHFTQLDEKDTYIWSSATLYTPEIINKRKKWFEKWVVENPYPTAASIFDFHCFAGDGDSTNSVLMNRNNEMLTVSITGIDIRMDTSTMHHFDLKENTHALRSLQLETTAV